MFVTNFNTQNKTVGTGPPDHVPLPLWIPFRPTSTNNQSATAAQQIFMIVCLYAIMEGYD